VGYIHAHLLAMACISTGSAWDGVLRDVIVRWVDNAGGQAGRRRMVINEMIIVRFIQSACVTSHPSLCGLLN
jgi:hypothetical protein